VSAGIGAFHSFRRVGFGRRSFHVIAYVYSSENPNDAFMRKVLTLDEARRIAANIAKLPALLGKVSED
jgi:hypothetical protein